MNQISCPGTKISQIFDITTGSAFISFCTFIVVNKSSYPTGLCWYIPLITVVILYMRHTIKYKKVYITNKSIIVADLFKHEEIPFSDINRVKARNRILGMPPYVRIFFDQKTHFGMKIIYVPKCSFLSGKATAPEILTSAIKN